MNRTYLIQRLKKPYKKESIFGKDNPFSFGGGLRHGGLSEEAMDLLRGIFSFDYMGAAEFEFGAVPKALQVIAKDHKKFVALSFNVMVAAVEKDWRDKSTDAPTGEKTIYVLCNKNDVEEVVDRITELAVKRYNNGLKETTHLAGTIRPYSDWDLGTVGWLELDNGFFFFVDEEMWKQTAELFGIETPN